MPEPVTLAEAREHLRIAPDDTSEDALIGAWITEARREVENETGLILVQREIVDRLDRFDGRPWLELAKRPVLDETPVAITYTDTAGDAVTLAEYRLTPSTLEAPVQPAVLMPSIGAYWPHTYSTPRAVSLTYLAGFASAEAVPSELKAVIKLLIGNKAALREGFVVGASYTPTDAIDRLLRPYWLVAI